MPCSPCGVEARKAAAADDGLDIFTRRAAFSDVSSQELRGHGGVAVSFPRGTGQLLAGDDPGLRPRHDMGTAPVTAVLRRLAGVPGTGVHRGDDPPAATLRAIRHRPSVPSDPQRAQRLARPPAPAGPARTPPAHPAHAPPARRPARSRRSPGLRPARPSPAVIPVDLRLTRPGVVVAGAHRRDLLRRPACDNHHRSSSTWPADVPSRPSYSVPS
jgi:hypothetical protein